MREGEVFEKPKDDTIESVEGELKTIRMYIDHLENFGAKLLLMEHREKVQDLLEKTLDEARGRARVHNSKLKLLQSEARSRQP